MIAGVFGYTIKLFKHTMVHRGLKALVVCGPSGTGKSSLLRRLFNDFPDQFGFSVSHTTRCPREGEVNGQHYHFTTREEMEKAIAASEFLETAVYSTNMYGTSKRAVEDVIRDGKICVLDIDVQGVKQMKASGFDALYLFIKPPSLTALENRLRERGTETEESLQRRLQVSQEELQYGETPGNFDLILVNDVLDKAYTTMKNFIVQELIKSGSSIYI